MVRPKKVRRTAISRRAASRRAASRSLARDAVPPLALRLARRARQGARRLPAEWEVLPGGFAQARRDAKIKGWNQQPVGDVYARELEDTRERIAAGVPFGLRTKASPADFATLFNHNLAMAWGHVLGRVAEQETQMSVLDWGGALGQYYLFARALRPDLTLDYTVKEMPLFAKQGAQLLPEVRFCGGDEALERQYDLTFASGSIHYEEGWRALIPRLLGSARRAVYLTRVPLVQNSDSFVLAQRPYSYGYATEYASWAFNREEFIDVLLSTGWRIEREMATGERIEVKGAREILEYRGFLLRPPEAS